MKFISNDILISSPLKMGKVILLLFLCHATAALNHSLKYFYTASSGVPNFPEFVIVGMVDGVQMFHYDSNTRRAEPKQAWMSRATADDPQYWARETGVSLSAQETFKANLKIAEKRFNQSRGVHVVQWLYGCEWDSETDEVSGVHQHGYDGEDFIVFDPKTETWIAPKQQAFITKQKLDHSRSLIMQIKVYLTQTCPEWLKKYVDYGRSSLLRTELPSVSLLQKTPSSPVSCHASGFYPDRATLIWRKDGEQLHEDVELGEILPNHDGTFQTSADLNVSSVPPEDWRRYDCVFHLSGVEDDIVTKLDKAAIRSNEKNSVVIPIIVAVVVLALVIVAALGFVVHRKKNVPVRLPARDPPEGQMRALAIDSVLLPVPPPGVSTSASANAEDNLSRGSTNSSAGSLGSDTPLMKKTQG
ncbi:class I histocompatibility antigen, F10 alpha chain-like [Chaetodon trifascialis]|uniref:class I histocompatibility antigen, F10 alpha chain-like n=1 Tax=Chaetodon trifascialis TaxID=109706 RepID=UPI0039931C28